ncbi:MAG: mechanosensitive ion channel [Rhodospirillales bacterium]|jgi:small conductance mechanosensitive channel|nr:mechanosensitive ion channel [Rhodospirillales bacterium]
MAARRAWSRVVVGGLAALILGLASAAWTPAVAQEVQAEQLESLLATVEDEAQRKVLIDQLKALSEARRGTAPAPQAESLGARLIATVSERTREIGEQVFTLARALSDFPVLLDWLRRQVTDAETREFWLGLLFKLAAVFAVGVAAERLAVALLHRVRQGVEDRADGGVVARAAFLVGRTAVDLIPVAIFVGIAYVMVPLVRPDPAMHVVAFTLVYAYVLVRAIGVAARAVLAPAVPALRLLSLGDESASYLFIWVRRLAGVAVIGYFAAEGALLLGLPPGAHAGLLRLVGLAVAVLVVVFVLQNRGAVAAWIRRLPTGRTGGTGIKGLRDRLADGWHVLAIAYVVGVYAVAALGIEDGFAFLIRATVVSVVIVVVARMAMAGLRRAVERGFAIGDDIKSRFPLLEARANRYLPVVHVVLRALVTVIAVLTLLYTWGLDAFGWLDTPLGQRMTRSAISIAAVLVIALIAWELVSSAVERYLSKTDDEGNAVARSARARTLLPLLRNIIFVVLAVMVTLIVLSELGINIAPLLAGAGVIGLAVGFGSQKLVQDVITGAFILFEDVISVGDVVRVAGQSGVVEAISIRSIRLRDVSGSVHTIPFSTVDTVTNMTKEFSYYVLEVGVAYREDTDEVVDILRAILDDMRDDPDWGAFIIDPLDVLGVDAFADSAVIIKARIKTAPIKQWSVGREFNRRMKKRFDEENIEIPFPHTTLYFGVDKAGTAPPARVAMEGTPTTDQAPAAGKAKGTAAKPGTDLPAEVGDEE